MIQKITASERDKEKFSLLKVDPESQKDDFFDYSKVVIKKPWGHEYLIYRNNEVAVWVLHINNGYQTSMHCHPNKKTSIISLAGEAQCSTLADEHTLKPGQGLFLGKGVFHSTMALSPEGILIMETETPTNKKDLVRLYDNYGRRGMGYEGQEHHLDFNDSELNSFHKEEERYLKEKKFGDCEVLMIRHHDAEDFKNTLVSLGGNIAAVLSGGLLNSKKESILEVGDVVSFQDIKNIEDVTLEEPIELLLIKKI